MENEGVDLGRAAILAETLAGGGMELWMVACTKELPLASWVGRDAQQRCVAPALRSASSFDDEMSSTSFIISIDSSDLSS